MEESNIHPIKNGSGHAIYELRCKCEELLITEIEVTKTHLLDAN